IGTPPPPPHKKTPAIPCKSRDVGHPPFQPSFAVPKPRSGEGQRNIIIVDDDPAVAECLSKFLIRQGYEVAGFSDSVTALERLKSSHYDLLITDINMPGITGVDLIRQVKAIRPALPAIAISAAWDEEMAKELFALDVRWYLPKPLDFGYFAFIVNIALANPNLHGPPP
ncbi:MAG: response regulator, partial [Planctomycetota bacterium]